MLDQPDSLASVWLNAQPVAQHKKVQGKKNLFLITINVFRWCKNFGLLSRGDYSLIGLRKWA